MDIDKLINQRKYTYDELKFIVDSYMNNTISDEKMTLFLKRVCKKGLSIKETIDLTDIYIKSGSVVDLSNVKFPTVDKHSTGGIGDKVSLIVGPIVAALDIAVPKMSGRGLGHTGGTIDKLESIEGFKVSLTNEEFINQVNDIGCAVISQTGNIVPADKKIYALRDVTGTVDSIPLIAASVMSKKIAAGADKILLEVTGGSGSFMESESRARVLAETMVNIGKMVDRETIAVITNMNQPLGKYCGNALETMEAIQTLKGKGESDVTYVCCVLGAYMLKLAGKGDDIVANMKLIQSKIDSKEGLKKFKELVERQGGDITVFDKPEQLMKARVKIPVEASESGYIYAIDAKNIGQAVVNIGGGRMKKEDSVDHYVGVEVLKKIGDEVSRGDILMYIHANNDEMARKQVEFLRNSYKYADSSIKKLTSK